MKFVHRHCLDEWRVQSLNPKTLVQCTTCGTPYRIKCNGSRDSVLPWRAKLALEISWYFALRILMFVACACVMGFMSPVAHMSPNPVANHLLRGSGIMFTLAGVPSLLYVMSHSPPMSIRLVKDLFRGTSKKDFGKNLLGMLIIFGICALLWILVKGIYRLICEARHELVGAVRGANAQTRRKLVQEHIVLDFSEDRQDGSLAENVVLQN